MRIAWRKIAEGGTLYARFEELVMLVLTGAVIVLVALATLHLLVGMVMLLLSDRLASPDPAVFQRVFGMFFTVVIGLEFKHSLVVSSAQESVVRARSIILIGMLATVRKFIVLDLATVGSAELVAVAAAILALGVVYWLVRDQDQKNRFRVVGGPGGVDPS